MRLLAVMCSMWVLVSCGPVGSAFDGGDVQPGDSGAGDAAVDAPVDAGEEDAGDVDAGENSDVDAGATEGDAGIEVDAGAVRLDAGVVSTLDSGVVDAGVKTPDAGVRDAGVQDAGVRDAGVPDAGPPDPQVLFPISKRIIRDSTFASPFSTCGKLYAPQSNTLWFDVFRSAPVSLTKGERLAIHGQASVRSSGTINILYRQRLYAEEVATGKRTYVLPGERPAVDGENHLGYCGPAPCQDVLTIQSVSIIDVPLNGMYTFGLEAGAATTGAPATQPDPSVWSGACDPSPVPAYTLTVVDDPALSFIEAFHVPAKAVYYAQDLTWAAGYAVVTSANSPLTLLHGAYVVPAGRTFASVFMSMGVTVSNAVTYATNAEVRVRVLNKRTNQIVYLPNSSGALYNILPQTHHKKVTLDGTIAALPGDVIDVKTEVWWVSGGPWLYLDVGCAMKPTGTCVGPTTRQAYTAIW